MNQETVGKAGELLIRFGSLLLGLAFVVSLVISPQPLHSLPWVLLGIAGTTALLSAYFLPGLAGARTSTSLPAYIITLGYLLLIILVLIVDWPEQKYSWLAAIYGNFPTLRSLPISGLEKGIQPNQIGGILAVVSSCSLGLGISRAPQDMSRMRKAMRIAAWPLFGLSAVAVFLTGSRAGLAALAIACILLLVIRDRRWLWAPAVLILVCLLSALLVPSLLDRTLGVFLQDETVSTKLVARLDIWGSALKGIEDHAFTGIGLGVFNDIVPHRYPYETVGLSYTVSQAHNIFLDTALTLGIPGALGLLCLISGLVITAIETIRSASLATLSTSSLLAGLAAFVVFGMTDSLGFSTPSSLMLWLCSFGIIAASRSCLGSTSDSRARYDTNNLSSLDRRTATPLPAERGSSHVT